jgi:hypothetical protein
MTDEEFSRQIHLLLDDCKAAVAANNVDDHAFCLWQIFELSRRHNEGKTPTPQQLKMLEDLQREKPIHPRDFQMLVDELDRRFKDRRKGQP